MNPEMPPLIPVTDGRVRPENDLRPLLAQQERIVMAARHNLWVETCKLDILWKLNQKQEAERNRLFLSAATPQRGQDDGENQRLAIENCKIMRDNYQSVYYKWLQENKKV